MSAIIMKVISRSFVCYTGATFIHVIKAKDKIFFQFYVFIIIFRFSFSSSSGSKEGEW